MSYSNESSTSSPDPLEMSHSNLELSSPPKQRRETPKLTPKKILGETSNNVRLHDIYLSTSPAAKNHSTTPKKGGAAQPPISPWRIRVIVQAEPENEIDNTAKPRHSIQPSIGRTVKTIVPLKQAGESVMDAQKRSGATPQKKLFKKRPGTPKPTGAGQHDSTSISSLKNTSDGIPQVATTPKRSRGRPRKSQGGQSEMLGGKPGNHHATNHVSPLDNLVELGLLGEMTGPRRRGRRKAPTPRKQATNPNAVLQGSGQGLQLGLETNEKESDSQQVSGLKRKIDTTSAPNKNERVKRSRIVVSSPHGDANKTVVSVARRDQEHPNQDWLLSHGNTLTRGNVPALESSPTPDTQHNGKFGSQLVTDSNVEKTTQSQFTRSHHFFDPTHEHREFDSILESEEFSMISVSTLPYGKVGLNIAGNDRQGVEGDPNLATILSPDLRRSSEGAAQHQLEVPSQHHEETLSVSAVKNIEQSDSRQTPLHMPSEPSNLPLLRPLGIYNAPRVLDEVTDSTPKIIRVVRAGTALQGVMGPQELAEVSWKRANQELDLSKSPRTGRESESNDIFDGFGAGTQRELRAGLRLGEELAKSLAGRSSQTSPRNTPLEHNASTQTTNWDSLGLSRPKGNSGDDLTFPNAGQHISNSAISNHQLPSPDRSEIDADEDQMSLDGDTSAQVEESVREDHDSQSDGGIDGVSYSSHNRTMEREAEWQREREEVVRQIEMANSSRVIVIDGDTDLQDEERFGAERMEEVEDTDIWQAEARSSDADLNYPGHQSHCIIQNQVIKPRRSRIPSPWRRQGRLGSAVQGNVGSDLFWRPGRAASEEIGTNQEQNPSPNASNPNDAARLREQLESSRYSHLDKDSMPKMKPNPSCTSDSDNLSMDELLDVDPDGGRGETKSPAVILESIERDEVTACQHKKTVDLPRTRPSKISIRQTKVEKRSRANDDSHTPKTSQSIPTAISTSWLKYIVSFLPSWNQPTVPKPLPLPRLPNGRRRLPVAVSEGPLCKYLPWTLDHWKALYVHYAAAREGRATFRFNRFGPTAWHIGVSHRYRHWTKPITQEDSAIADAFLSDLRRRGVATPPHNGVLIDDYKVLGMLFYIWKAGVMNGECEVGVGKTGWQTGSEEWWRPDMESWYRG